MFDRKNKLLKLLLILPLFIALTIFCYASSKHQKTITNRFSLNLPLKNLAKDENVEYFNVKLTNDVFNQKDTFSLSDHPSETEQIEIPITNKTYILKTVPKIADSVITKRYEVFLDDRVYSREDIKVDINNFLLKKILYQDTSLGHKKEIILKFDKPDDSFLTTKKIFYDKNSQKNNTILQASRKPEDLLSKNPHLFLNIDYILNYQKIKANPQIQELINDNVQLINLEIESIIATEE